MTSRSPGRGSGPGHTRCTVEGRDCCPGYWSMSNAGSPSRPDAASMTAQIAIAPRADGSARVPTERELVANLPAGAGRFSARAASSWSRPSAGAGPDQSRTAVTVRWWPASTREECVTPCGVRALVAEGRPATAPARRWRGLPMSGGSTSKTAVAPRRATVGVGGGETDLQL